MSKEWKQQSTNLPTIQNTGSRSPVRDYEEWAKDILCAMIVSGKITTGDEAMVNKALTTLDALCFKLNEKKLRAGSEN